MTVKTPKQLTQTEISAYSPSSALQATNVGVDHRCLRWMRQLRRPARRRWKRLRRYRGIYPVRSISNHEHSTCRCGTPVLNHGRIRASASPLHRRMIECARRRRQGGPRANGRNVSAPSNSRRTASVMLNRTRTEPSIAVGIFIEASPKRPSSAVGFSVIWSNFRNRRKIDCVSP